jgi:RNA polymerase sigma-70 factor (ECF subfamily)
VEAQCYFIDQQQTESNERSLVERIANQDQDALQEFYDRYHKLVFSLALKILNSWSESEEVTIDVFWQVWQQAGQYNPSRGSVGAWIVMIARSRAIDRRRSRERQNANTISMDNLDFTNVEAGTEYNPEKSFYSLEKREAVRNALAEMNEKQRHVIELAYFKGLSQTEIAALLEEPLGTVKTRIRAGMQFLREKLTTYLQVIKLYK